MKYKIIIALILLFSLFIRIYKINEVPASLFGDELDLGYQAYSILKTGNDYYGNPWPMHFHSLAEWRTPLYLYSSVPTVALFGISPLGVRLPAVIFGVLSIYFFYLLILQISSNNKSLALLSAFLLAISPWHIQYSRGGFEVTQLLFFFLLGMYLFLKSIKNPKWFPFAAICFMLMPLVYSTAKFFTPIFLAFILVIWRKDIIKFPRKQIGIALFLVLLIGLPITYSTLFGGGTQRFGHISVFTDPTIEPEIGASRAVDALVRNRTGESTAPIFTDRLFHNKFTFWFGHISNNYMQAFSTNFLFIEGDLNLRHSIEKVGQFYMIEALFLVIGLVSYFGIQKKTKSHLLVLFILIVGVIPSSITRDGGMHATRLFIILPSLIFLIATGIQESVHLVNKRYRPIIMFVFASLYIVSFARYQHEYWVHYPWYSERWWHAGFEESIKSIKAVAPYYDKVVITTANEPPWVFFAAWYEYSPDEWQKNFPTEHKKNLPGFGDVSYIDKFYFGSPEGNRGLYDWGKVLDEKTLYLASEKEVRVNLIMEPERTPGDLKLIKSIAYPSGEPAYYLFSGTAKE